MANKSVDITDTSAIARPKVDVDIFLVTQLVSFAVIIPIIVVGNFLICWIEFKRKTRRSSSYFIINLALSDLSVGLISIPLDIAEQLSKDWPFFGFVCKLVYPFQTVVMAVSVITLLCMTVERYRAVVTPFKCKPSGRFIVKAIISIWAMSFLLVTPYTLVLKMKNSKCVEDWPNQDRVRIYTVSVFSVLYLLPLTLITIFYTRIGLYLQKEAKRWKSMTKYYGSSIRQVRRIAQSRRKQNVKIIKAFVAAVMTFAVCQLPTHVIWLWHDFGTGSEWEHLNVVLPFCHILTYLNSAIDPFIFGSLDAQLVRRNLRSVFNIQCSREQNKGNTAAGKGIHKKEWKEQRWRNNLMESTV